MFWSPHKSIQQLPPTLLKPIHQNSCGIFSLQRNCTKKLHSGYSVYKDMIKMCILTSESGTQNSPSSHQDPLNWPFPILNMLKLFERFTFSSAQSFVHKLNNLTNHLLFSLLSPTPAVGCYESFFGGKKASLRFEHKVNQDIEWHRRSSSLHHSI